jgi:hypothetical protein
MRRSDIATLKVEAAEDRRDALGIVERVYREEKRWIGDAEPEIPAAIAADTARSWFLVRVGGEPAGVIRLAYDPPLAVPPELDFHFERGIDPVRMAAVGRYVEIGRFMILPRHRGRARVALALMRAAVKEVAERGYTHLITDVFESDPHSPLRFHTRVLGFERIGTHRFGELACRSVRIVLVLDLARTYQRLKHRRDRVFRELADGLQDLFEALPATPALRLAS